MVDLAWSSGSESFVALPHATRADANLLVARLGEAELSIGVDLTAARAVSFPEDGLTLDVLLSALRSDRPMPVAIHPQPLQTADPVALARTATEG